MKRNNKKDLKELEIRKINVLEKLERSLNF